MKKKVVFSMRKIDDRQNILRGKKIFAKLFFLRLVLCLLKEEAIVNRIPFKYTKAQESTQPNSQPNSTQFIFPHPGNHFVKP
jgi:hypothetical protein